MSRQREGHGVCNQPTVRERQLWDKTGLEETRAERGSWVSRRSGGLESQVQLHFFAGGGDWTGHGSRRAGDEAQMRGADEEASIAVQEEDDGCLNEGSAVGMKRSRGGVSHCLD